MKKALILHNPRCSKSRETLQILQEQEIDVEIQEYLKDSLTKQEILDILVLLKLRPLEIIRKSEEEYKSIISTQKVDQITDEMWLDFMEKYPKLIERPIVIYNNKAIIGRPPQKVLDIF
jgi:arsenate reductase